MIRCSPSVNVRDCLRGMAPDLSSTINELVAPFYGTPETVSTKYLVLKTHGMVEPVKRPGLVAIAALAILLIGGAVFFFRSANRAPLSQREVATHVLAE